MTKDDPFWHITYNKYHAEDQPLRESLCTLGNGFFATRGAMEESSDSEYHYPGTYLAGGYNRLTTEISGKLIENEDLVNWPNWLLIKFKIHNGEWYHPDKLTILDYKQKLNLKAGILERLIHFKDDKKREWVLESRRLVSMANEHLAAIEWKITAINWSGNITIHSALDGRVFNNGVSRYRQLDGHHLNICGTYRFEEDGISLVAETKQSGLRMAQSAKTIVNVNGNLLPVERKTLREEKYIGQELTFPVKVNEEVTIQKTVAIYTSRDKAISDPINESQLAIHRASPFQELFNMHFKAWQEIWERVDTDISCADEEDQRILRLHIFHLYQTASFNTVDLDVGIPSRGWHGEAYRGHVFWDELFIFPLLSLSSPEITRSLLMYRYRRLPEARYNALENGFKGAMFPWQSGSNGREESQVIHLNPESGRWLPDNTFLQRHVNSALVYNIWRYFQVTNDHNFMSFYGAEMILDIAQFWASKATWDEDKKKYVINQVVGPDEYHTSYPESTTPGINNNAYTNIMTIYVFNHALKTLELLDERVISELKERLGITREDILRWGSIAREMFIPFQKNGFILNQFEGFEDLQDIDWKHYHSKYGEILRLDRILEKEGDNVNKYKAVKQADAIMLFYLFSADELKELIETAGYKFKPESIPKNIAYYNKITSHGSTLSKLVFSWVLARSHRSKSYHNFRQALLSDFKDIQGGTTSEGIHLGAMAGTVDLIRRCYTGMEIREEALWFNPQLPDELKFIKFRFKFRNHWIFLHLTNDELTLIGDGGWASPKITVIVKGEKFHLKRGKKKVFRYTDNQVELLSKKDKPQ